MKKTISTKEKEDKGDRFKRGFVVASICVFLSLRFFVDGMSYPHFNFFWNMYFFALLVIHLATDRLKNTCGKEEILLLLYFLFCAISTGTAQIKGTGIVFNTQMLAYWCIFVLTARNFTPKNARTAFNIILVSGLFVLLYGLYQHFWGLEQTRQYVYSRPELLNAMSPTYINRLDSDRVFATFVYPNVFASFLLFLIPLSFFPSFSKEKLPLKILCLAVFFLSLWNLFLTGSFGGFFIFLFIAQIMLLFLLLGNSKRFKTVISILLFFEILLLSAGYHTGKLPKISSFADRVGYWKSSVGVFMENPATGVGPENYRYHYPAHKPSGGMEAKHPHSVFFAALSETGVAGMSFLFAFLITVSAGLFKISGNSPFFMGLAFSFLAFFMHNLIDFNFINPSAAVLFFITGGLGAAASKAPPPFTPASAKKEVKKESSANRTALTKCLNCLIIIAVLFTAAGYTRYVLSEENLLRAQKEQNINGIFYYLEKAQRLYPDNFEVYNAKGDVFYRIFSVTGDVSYEKKAESFYRHAVLLNPRLSAVYRKLAAMYETSGKMKSAERMYLKLLETYPNKKQYNIETALFYKKKGDEKNFLRYYQASKKLHETSTEEAFAVADYKKWIESQK